MWLLAVLKVFLLDNRKSYLAILSTLRSTSIVDSGEIYENKNGIHKSYEGQSKRSLSVSLSPEAKTISVPSSADWAFIRFVLLRNDCF